MTRGDAPDERRRADGVVDLLGELQRSVDRAKAERKAARTVPCDRADRHPAHTYVATPKSGVDLYCEGRSA